MRLSTRTRYGTRLLFELAYNYGKGPVLLKDIAERQDISEKYLSKIIMQLKSSGIVNSFRGAHGGYELASKPSAVNMLQVYEALEGESGLVECTGEGGECERIVRCPARDFWCRLENSMTETMKGTTLEDIVNDFKLKNGEQAEFYHI
jgi:Rrf2 family protein